MRGTIKSQTLNKFEGCPEATVTGFRTYPEYYELLARSITVTLETTDNSNNNLSVYWNKRPDSGGEYNNNWLLVIQLMLPTGEVVHETTGM